MRLQKKCYPLFGLCILLFLSCQTGKQNSQHLYTNELIHESSPYLLQHAHNPVNWYPWGEKALEKAKAEQKMLLVSVGYAACHWCHVMESECFEDTAVARLMNTYFVCIKVDREERPDIDNTYMSACQMIAGQNCGWPLNSIALPDGKPVWTGTYFPKKEWMERLNFFKDEWKKNRSAMEAHAAKIASGIQTNTIFPDKPSAQALNRAGIDALANGFMKNQDPVYGGRRGAPKFPTPVNTRFLLEYGQSCNNPNALKAAYTILDKMLEGGIYDHLGGGFARYATDDKWMVPHFEKMLYDNAQLVSLYAQAYLQSGNPAYKKVVYETLEFVQRELTSPEGAFYASLDADSEGAEGKFYVWKQAEIAQILGDAGKTALFCDYFNVQAQGNWEAGANILQRPTAAATIAKAHQLTPEALEQQIAQSKKQLLDARARRVRPKLDDKALTAWNALMISAYVDAYKAFGEPGFLNAALKNAQLITQKIMQADHRLLRNYKDNKAIINGFLDDYAATATAFQALYEVTFDEKWLNLAKSLTEYALQHFQQKDQALLYYSSDLDPLLIARNIEIADQVIPASNSVMARNLFVLGNYFYNDTWVEQSQNMLRSVLSDPNLKSAPDFYSNWCRLYLNFSNPFYEIAIVGPEADLRRNELMAHFLPNSLLLGGAKEGSLELLKGKLQANQTNIYVCGNKVCKKPVSATESALEILR